MRAIRCKDCGKLLSTHVEKVAHYEERTARTGCIFTPTEESEADRAYREKCEKARQRGFDMQKMLERQEASKPAPLHLTWKPFRNLGKT